MPFTHGNGVGTALADLNGLSDLGAEFSTTMSEPSQFELKEVDYGEE
jgi:hypothetical protein